MKPVLAIIAPGAMGSAIARRLIENGIDVITSLNGRSNASSERAIAAGMRPVSDTALAEADILLSIIPPGDALAMAERLAGILAKSSRKPIYVDCNAISPQRAIRIGEVVGDAGMRFVDAGIIGRPPQPGEPCPPIYISGEHASALNVLSEYGLNLKRLEAGAGAASGLKMSYSGMNKGITALGVAMALAATDFGVGEALRQELAASAPNIMAILGRNIEDMYPKAYRWIAEMQEIAEFAGDNAASNGIYRNIAELYQLMADDHAGDRTLSAKLSAFVHPEPGDKA